MLPLPLLYDGRTHAPPERIPLRAGPLTLVYENGDLRYIALEGHEIVRRLYVAVRDRNWGTIPIALSNVQVDARPDSFALSYDAEHRRGDVHFSWRGAIAGDASGGIRFSLDGEAQSTFLRNRIGFCILHPVRECAGQPCRVEHDDGSFEEGFFPQFIAPHQPFLEMRAISHPVQPGVWAELRFAGDIFEMEDQRNWTDASFKTYCTPLRLPYPVEIVAGTRVEQVVELSIKDEGRRMKDGSAMRPAPERGAAVGTDAALRSSNPSSTASLTFILHPSSLILPFPRLGLGSPDHGQPLRAREVELLRALSLAHLRADITPANPGFHEALERATADARTLGVPLYLSLFLADADGELRALRQSLEALRPSIGSWLIFSSLAPTTPEPLVALARRYLADYAPDTRFVGGSNQYFTHLNRNRPPAHALDAVCFSINPQVHAFDNSSLVENVAGQAAVVESARQFCDGKPIVVGPVTLLPRSNPDATDGSGRSAAPADRRQATLFGAAWTVGSLKYLAESGADSVTYYETSGPRGVLASESVFPLYHALADAGALAPGNIVLSTSSNPLLVDGLAVELEGRLVVLLANMTDAPQQVALAGVGESAHVRTLDETSAEEAMAQPEAFRARAGEALATTEGELTLTLLPYAVARIEATMVSANEAVAGQLHQHKRGAGSGAHK